MTLKIAKSGLHLMSIELQAIEMSGSFLFGPPCMSSSVACILTTRDRVHDAAAGDAVLSTPPGHVEAKVQHSKVLLQVALGLTGGRDVSSTLIASTSSSTSTLGSSLSTSTSTGIITN